MALTKEEKRRVQILLIKAARRGLVDPTTLPFWYIKYQEEAKAKK